MSNEKVDEGRRQSSPQPLQTFERPRLVRRSVSFGQVRVREFDRILDINPACSGGPSIGLGWKYKAKKPVSLQEWENSRNSNGSLFFNFKRPSSAPRKAELCVLTTKEREKIAKKFGFTKAEIAMNVQNNIREKSRLEWESVMSARKTTSLNDARDRMMGMLQQCQV